MLGVMSPSAKLWITSFATLAVTYAALAHVGPLLMSPCSSGFPYRLCIAVFPFGAFFSAFEINIAPVFYLILIVAQYPAYGFFLGRAWIRRKPLAAFVVPAAHILAAGAAAIGWRHEL